MLLISFHSTMCGIYGYFSINDQEAVDGAHLSQMGTALKHRGPDDEGVMIDRRMAMGHKRLSIIDLSENGRQPLSNEDGTIWLVFNGEIYNFLEFVDGLKAKGHRFRSKTDTEVIIHLYEEYGSDAIAMLNGMFAFVLWDKKKDEVYMARDRMGIKPLHYATIGNTVIFASEIKALLRHPDVSKEIDLFSLNEYLSFEYVPAPHSIFKDIRKLLPAHFLLFRKNQASLCRYWNASGSGVDAKRSEQSYADELSSILNHSVKRHLVSDVPLGAFLSGGIDSSTVCALMRQHVPGRVKAFSITFEDKSFDEARFSKRVAQDLGVEHFTEPLSSKRMLELVPQIMNYLDEPFGDASFVPTYLLCRFARQHVKVSLSGDGSDELFAGYPTYQAFKLARYYDFCPSFLKSGLKFGVRRLPVSFDNISFDFKLKKFFSDATDDTPLRRHYRWLGSFEPRDKPLLFSNDVYAIVQHQNEYALAEEISQETGAGIPLSAVLRCDQRFYLQDNMLVKMDRASMASSLEARVPFLDNQVVDFAARLPDHLKLHGLTTKYILKKAMRGTLASQILYRKKKGFGIPVAKWFSGELLPLLKDLFQPDRIRRAGIFNPAFIQKLIHEHSTMKADHRKKLYTLFNFELWYQKYMLES